MIGDLQSIINPVRVEMAGMIVLEEKYPVRVSTRNYKGPELLTNNFVDLGFSLSPSSTTIIHSIFGRFPVCWQPLSSTVLLFSAEKTTSSNYIQSRKYWEQKI